MVQELAWRSAPLAAARATIMLATCSEVRVRASVGGRLRLELRLGLE